MSTRYSLLSSVLLALSMLSSNALAASGSFSFLTYNVAGLPAIINNNGITDKTAAATAIGAALAAGGYDVAHLQEDFNYHAAIYAADNHPDRTATSGGVPFGSGLNTVANYGWSTFNRIKWDACNLNGGDCLTPKGFTFMRMQIATGVEVDFYNLHGDAGSETGDANARRTDVQQMLAYIDANSVGRAVIVAGDTNDRYTNSAVSITLFAGAGFDDAWVQLVNGGTYPTPGATANPCAVPAASTTCEVVDKVLYRQGSTVKLTAKTFAYANAAFSAADGSALSDHNPLLVNFTWTA